MLLAAAIIFSYPLIKNKAAGKYVSPFEDGEVLVNDAYQIAAAVYGNAVGQGVVRAQAPESPEAAQTDEWKELAYYFGGKYAALDSVYQNIDYRVEIGTLPVFTDTSRPLEHALSAGEEEDELDGDYQCLLALSFDDAGKASLIHSFGVNGRDAQRQIDEMNAADLTPKEYRGRAEAARFIPQNVTVVAALARDVQWSDRIGSLDRSAVVDAYTQTGVNLIYLTALLLSAALALLSCFPCAGRFYLEESRTAGLAAELLAAALIWIAGRSSDYRDLIINTNRGELAKSIAVFTGTGVITQALAFLINLAAWALLLVLSFLTVRCLRHMIKIGLRRYLQENSFLYRKGRACTEKTAAAYRRMTERDLSQPVSKTLKTLLVLHTALVALVACFWFWGIVLILPIYSLALYRIVKKSFSRVQENYARVLAATKEMAGGNLDVDLDRSFGIFDSLRQNLLEIRTGFRVAVDQEVRSQRMKTELITNVSHDLKTPLTAIISYVDLLKDESITPQQRAAYVATLDQKSQRLKTLIEDLFEISKANSGSVKMEIALVDLVQLFRQTRVELADRLEASGLDFRFALPEEKVILPLDSQKMFRIFENLLGNIVKYAAPRSRVYISMEVREGRAVTVMKNVSEQELGDAQTDLTERFVRGDKARNTEGSGLGLAIVRSFAELQGGAFSVETDGDLFKTTLSFPVKEPTAPEE